MPQDPNQTKAEFIVLAVEMIITHGVPTALQIIRTLQNDDPTIEEIRALKGAIKDPASYFQSRS